MNNFIKVMVIHTMSIPLENEPCLVGLMTDESENSKNIYLSFSFDQIIDLYNNFIVNSNCVDKNK